MRYNQTPIQTFQRIFDMIISKIKFPAICFVYFALTNQISHDNTVVLLFRNLSEGEILNTTSFLSTQHTPKHPLKKH